ncbi:acetyl-CoA carboxylase biotin carboxylase subunit [Gemmobacter fulvus]|uniref:acetyl-CoA carboxylase biotin carboxylase subunit n=1 Tax=Gemmobacter fulvus TaxID=2840474 RepID=UPI00279652DB|nr:acetyl-CoA carboxylase biotin carboxylase subunit [Gemmobacter fulvus]MDQ1850604.1 acetyl-CoA carboxylase biotin carboxylase subunit [Gemmobacter fulvus]
MTMQKLFIANRGEIAVRIIRAAQQMGIKTVLGVSEADVDSLAARMADETVLLGPARASESYLNIPRVMDAIRQSNADAVHPGYGFLSENAAFVAGLEAAGTAFVGPRSETIAAMGDKAEARRTAIAASVPVVPGSDGPVANVADALRLVEQIGYPLMIKAAAGGGGRGIRIANTPEDLASVMPVAQAEAKAAFGDDTVYLERYLARVRHVEVQILGDGDRVVHLHERECSLQRKRQKVWEEAPAIMLPASVREALCNSAVKLAASVGYRGAGTIEYLYEDATREFFFIEMNTRIQVEHPITEEITGIDIVQAQLRIARGERLWLEQDQIRICGHAIEVRLNAENPARKFMPNPGKVSRVAVPKSARFDTLLYNGCTVVPFYDSLIGKLVVSGADRDDALQKLRTALAELEIEGIATTRDLHCDLVEVADIQAGAVHSLWLETWLGGKVIQPAKAFAGSS